MISVYLSLGSNIGDKKAYLEAALERLNQLPQTSLAAVSSFYETAAWGKTDQDNFLNICCQLKTELAAQQLLIEFCIAASISQQKALRCRIPTWQSVLLSLYRFLRLLRHLKFVVILLHLI